MSPACPPRPADPSACSCAVTAAASPNGTSSWSNCCAPHLHAVYQDAQRRQAGVPRLTARQWELLRLVAAGHSNADIARQLFLSENTVRKHLENIYQRLSVSSRTAAVALAFQSGYPTQPAG